jgi:hypothetical protein
LKEKRKEGTKELNCEENKREEIQKFEENKTEL